CYLIGLLPLSLRGGADVIVVPMGRAPTLDRAARAPVRAHASRTESHVRAPAARARSLARMGAVVQTHGAVGGHEARERRSHVAPSDHARLPPLDPTAAAVAGMVRAMAARMD